MKIAIAVATAGRPDLVPRVLQYMATQSRPADILAVCPATPKDCDLDRIPKEIDVRVISSSVGSCAQRNALIREIDADVMVFFDDDFLPAPDFLFELEKLMTEHGDVVVATGHVAADGINGPGFDYEEALGIVEDLGPNVAGNALTNVNNGYGCNMAIRLDVAKSQGITFDENLPLYGWLEDVDFSRRLAAFGRVVKSERLRGVHMGTKTSGRSPGKRLGYSQMANRIYLVRKGTLTRSQMWSGNFNNLAANTVKSLAPEPWVDRRGRLLGNSLALWDWMTRKLDTTKITKFK